jgi:hypothetical protein
MKSLVVVIVLAAKLIGIYSFLIQEYQPVSMGTLSPAKPWRNAKDERQSTSTTISMQSSESSSSSFATSNAISYSTRPGTD